MPRTSLSLFLVLASSVFGAEPEPDFRLTDVSTSSARPGAVVSPRDYVMQVSGYYFGEAT
jgi:hypothetical protein